MIVVVRKLLNVHKMTALLNALPAKAPLIHAAIYDVGFHRVTFYA